MIRSPLFVGCSLLVSFLLLPQYSFGQQKAGESSDDAELKRELVALFDNLRVAAGQRPLDFDVDRFFDVNRVTSKFLESIGEEGNDIQRTIMNVAMRNRFRQSLSQNGPTWERLTIDRIGLSEDGTEAVALVRFWDFEGFSYRQRYWFENRDDRWRIFDVEDIGLALKASTSVITLGQEILTGGDTSAATRQIQTLEQAIATMNGGDYYTAGELLNSLEGELIPESLEPLRWILRANVAVSIADHDATLACVSRALEYQEDLPIAHYLRSIALNGAGRHEEALGEAAAFMREVGEDAEAYNQIAIAHESMGRMSEAKAAYLRGLDDSPDSLENFLGLAGLADESDKPELIKRYLARDDPQGEFDGVASHLVDTENAVTLEAMTVALRQVAPDDPNSAYYGAMAYYFRGQYADAAQLLAPIFDQVTADEKSFYYELFYDCCLAAGQIEYAYEHAPDERGAFRYLTEYLAAEADWAAIAELVDLHQSADPDDPRIQFVLGETFYYQGRYEEADAAYALVPENRDQELNDSVSIARLMCWFQNGRAVEALDEFSDVENAFEMLANQFVAFEDGDGLLKLVRANADRMDELEREFWTCQSAWLSGELAKAARVGVALLPKLEPELDWLERMAEIESIVIRAYVRQGAPAKAMRIAKASTARDGDPYFEVIVYARQGKAAELRAALEHCLQSGYVASTFLYDNDVREPLDNHPDLREVLRWLEGM